MRQTVFHTLQPIFDSKSRILILGSMPSPQSRSKMFYYAHPQNRFWTVISSILNQPFPKDNTEKCKMLLDNNIALWDVIYSCEIDGASDSSIRNAIPNDLCKIIDESEISYIFTIGNTANVLYNKLCSMQTGIKAVCLPSTSPANARWTLQKLIDAYSCIGDIVKGILKSVE